jgi:hypothetical protein
MTIDEGWHRNTLSFSVRLGARGQGGAYMKPHVAGRTD